MLVLSHISEIDISVHINIMDFVWFEQSSCWEYWIQLQWLVFFIPNENRCQFYCLQNNKMNVYAYNNNEAATTDIKCILHCAHEVWCVAMWFRVQAGALSLSLSHSFYSTQFWIYLIPGGLVMRARKKESGSLWRRFWESVFAQNICCNCPTWLPHSFSIRKTRYETFHYHLMPSIMYCGRAFVYLFYICCVL